MRAEAIVGALFLGQWPKQMGEKSDLPQTDPSGGKTPTALSALLVLVWKGARPKELSHNMEAAIYVTNFARNSDIFTEKMNHLVR